ncbi:hypothetical protein ColTof4_14411 [Colletotrichum tofieldiae]|nr:hypothetical protein ColTof4_14411 [Colletotrichum tofieldiae]
MALPIDTTAWAAAVDAVKIGNAPLRHVSLGDMSARSFSGSTIPHATCLQLRALWPPARRPYQARADLELDDDSGTLPLFNSDDASLAESLLDNSPRLDHFLSVMALRDGPDDDDPFPPSTPIVSRSTLRNADKLGMFGPSVTSWRRLRLFQEAPREQRLLFTPKARPGPAAQFLLSHNVSKLDLKKPVQQAPSDGEDHSSSDTEDGSSASLWTSFERLALSPCSPSVTTKRNAATSAPAREQPSGAGLLATPQPSLAAAVSQPRRVYSGRTEYEVQTSHFFVTYVDTLLSHALSLDLVNHISVVPQEKRYKFGTQANPEASTSGQKDCLFVACPDGAIYANLGPGRRKAYMFFELKPFRRDQMARGRLICREETAEMAAIMYEEYVAGGR